jgi:Spy/CpxP family protein refolding chaperone
MRHHRYLALAMVAGGLFAAAAPLAAQQSNPPRGPAARVLEHRKDLQLTDAQVKKLEALEKSQASMAAQGDSAMRAYHTEWDKARSDVMAVLTPPQREKVDSLRKTYRDQYSKGREGKGHGEHTAPHDSTPG